MNIINPRYRTKQNVKNDVLFFVSKIQDKNWKENEQTRRNIFLCLISIGEIVKYVKQSDFDSNDGTAFMNWDKFASLYRKIRNHLCHYPFEGLNFLELNESFQIRKDGEPNLNPKVVEVLYDKNFNVIGVDENTGLTLVKGINECIRKKNLEKLKIYLNQLK
ncbi:hypothetical protein HDU92_002704 [Lobulomyces angularis]|nr:hypothetical protein HDU92_002704 [Lobulomyces angularis]